MLWVLWQLVWLLQGCGRLLFGRQGRRVHLGWSEGLGARVRESIKYIRILKMCCVLINMVYQETVVSWFWFSWSFS